MEGYCMRCKGIVKAVVGALILINAFVWPMWLGIDGWLKFAGVLLLVGGIIKAFKPGCCCKSCCETSASCCEMPAQEAKLAKAKKK